jgi:hypothetical protein
MRSLTYSLGFATALGLLVWGCDKPINPVGTEPNAPPNAMAMAKTTASAPSPLVNVNSTLEFWSYTGVDYSGTPQDPVNLIFVGQGEPRAIRDILLSLARPDKAVLQRKNSPSILIKSFPNRSVSRVHLIS